MTSHKVTVVQTHTHICIGLLTRAINHCVHSSTPDTKLNHLHGPLNPPLLSKIKRVVSGYTTIMLKKKCDACNGLKRWPIYYKSDMLSIYVYGSH